LSEATHGYCKLTGSKGKFVKSHIVPKSLTRSEEPGLPLMESRPEGGVKKKWDSWYDKKLVIRKGEDFLSKIDNSAIAELRKQSLLWSSFERRLPGLKRVEGIETHGFRKIIGLDPKPVWLFAASIAWRASVSTIPEMRWFKLTADEEAHLQKSILMDKPAYKKFPVSLIQLSSQGLKHNHTPTLDTKITPDLGQKGGSREIQFARIYAEGLIFHLNRTAFPIDELSNNSLFVGCDENLMVTCIDFEASDQKDRILEAVGAHLSHTP